MNFKASFCTKLSNLKNKGQMQETMVKTQVWVDKNIDSLFESFKQDQTKCSFEYVKSLNDQEEGIQKLNYRNFLLDVAEKKVTKRRKVIRYNILK